jgi:hypothetical protein
MKKKGLDKLRLLLDMSMIRVGLQHEFFREIAQIE